MSLIFPNVRNDQNFFKIATAEACKQDMDSVLHRLDYIQDAAVGPPSDCGTNAKDQCWDLPKALKKAFAVGGVGDREATAIGICEALQASMMSLLSGNNWATLVCLGLYISHLHIEDARLTFLTALGSVKGWRCSILTRTAKLCSQDQGQ